LKALPAAGVPAPPHPPGKRLLAATVEAWSVFWGSDLASLVKPADLPPLTRLFRMYDLRERMERALLTEPFVTGSTGQIVAHPAAKEVASLDGRIEKLEARFGITPKGRMDLGVAMGAAARSLEELNDDFDRDRDQEEEVDPRRLGVIDVGG
jgi:P27 family predicted phage terminase small subunit